MKIVVEFKIREQNGKFQTRIAEFQSEADFKKFCQSAGIIILNIDCRVA